MGFEEVLLRAELYAYLPKLEMESLVRELISELETLGFVASIRAEGYAFLPAGLPVPTHIRAGVYEGAVSVWIRGASEVEESSKALNIAPEEYFANLMKGLRKAAEIFGKFSERGIVKVSIPEV